MHQIRLIAFTGRLALRLAGAAFLLLIYLLAAAPLSPLLAAVLAVADNSHHLSITQNSEGVTLLLQHGTEQASIHRHGALAKALTFVAQRSSPSRPDHLIHFANSILCEQVTETIFSSPEQERDSFTCYDLTFCESKHDGRSQTLPPYSAGRLLALRSIVLLL